jgi:hypothetical protein
VPVPQNLKAQPRAAAVHNIAKKSSVAGSLGLRALLRHFRRK